ncbi:MAG: sulfurtransferase [Methanotrichaceae archaeon]
MGRKLLIFLGIAIIIMALFSYADAACPPGGCGSGSEDWETTAQSFINSDVPMVGASIQDMTKGSSLKVGQAATGSTLNDAESLPKSPVGSSKDSSADFIQAYRSDSFPKGKYLKAMQSVSSSDLILDVSNNHSKGDAIIRGAVSIPAKRFIYENGKIRPVSEITEILGDAGISSDDSVVVYSSSFESGEAAFVFWLMKYTGQESVKLLDGDLDDWTEASLPLDIKPKILPKVNYAAKVDLEMLADYAYVKSGIAQVVDARNFQDFGDGRIPDSFWIPTSNVLENGKVKDAVKLNDTFSKLNKGKPVVVYSTDIANASLVWYALQLMGFDSKVYTWADWEAHEKPQAYDIK